ncbi:MULTISPECIES: cbb3-type cytochrome oxidase subunit 3 [Amphritea]|uniref:Cbb3-type cytochrome oxidase component FixQ n=2 Tax=Amphritea TaxID=515417 RepID=A0A1H9FKL1_9GAMM|nr:cbb3-type cytochrome c oxidase subunit 3 [Amphritea atlantica]MBN0986154.1 cbb3-type cytochrome c oxidase subunit 3 [Amphritea pacifica]MBN1007560.1 cbb3-type cytochrome c oxidase subunit 3 [Amphritea pacifica]SEQ38444.1 Cbb3-type cytochrome oxidase component FixQ [Amphritea atlantica]
MSYEVYGPYLPAVMIITFIALFIWVLLPGNRKRFDEASQLPFADEDEGPANADETNDGRNEK